MALIICPECNQKVSSKAAACPHCGCPIELSNFEPVNITNRNANEIIRYAELARSAINGNNGDEAYSYIVKILELDPANIDALEMKLTALQLTSTLGNLRIQETLECGSSIIRYSPENMRTENQHKLYLFYLNRALELLQIAITQTNDCEQIKKTFESFALVSIFQCGQNTLQADTPFIQAMENLANRAMELKLQVPPVTIHDNPDYINLTTLIADSYNLYTQALIDRYKIYGVSLNQDAIVARQTILSIFRDGIPTPEELALMAKKRKEDYWANHPVEKSELEEKIRVSSDRKAKLLAELKALSIFQFSAKKELQSQLDIIDKDILAAQQELNMDRD